MSLWSRIRGWLSPPATPQLAPAGKLLRWRQGARWTVYLGSGAHDWWGFVEDAMRELEEAAGRRLWLGPLVAIPELRAMFAKDPVTALWPRDAVFVRLEEGRGDPAHPGHTRHEYDPRTGLVNAAVVTVPGAARADLIAPLLPLIALHEMAHVLGIGHSRDQLSVMYPRLASVGQRLTAEDRRAVRRAVG